MGVNKEERYQQELVQMKAYYEETTFGRRATEMSVQELQETEQEMAEGAALVSQVRQRAIRKRHTHLVVFTLFILCVCFSVSRHLGSLEPRLACLVQVVRPWHVFPDGSIVWLPRTRSMDARFVGYVLLGTRFGEGSAINSRGDATGGNPAGICYNGRSCCLISHWS